MKTITSKQTANEAATEILKIVNAFGKVTWNCMTFEKVDGSKIKVTGSAWNYKVNSHDGTMCEMYPSVLADLVLFPERKMVNDVIRTHYTGFFYD